MNYKNYPENEWAPADKANIAIPEEKNTSLFKRYLLRIAGRKAGSKENLNVFRMMLYGSSTYTGFMLFLNGLLGKKSAIKSPEKDRIIIRACYKFHCTYEYSWHVRMGREVGLSNNEILRISQPKPQYKDERMLTLFQAVDELCDQKQFGPETMQALKQIYSDRQIFELCELVGNYAMVSTIDNALEMPLENNAWL